MRDFLLHAWTFQYSLLPCVVAYLVFDFSTIVRRLTRKAYVPIYFMFFPYGYTDELYARYFDEDVLQILGPPLSDREKVQVRKRIVWVSAISMIFAVGISPFLAGIFSYFVLTPTQFVEFLWTLALVKCILLIRSLWELKHIWIVRNSVPLCGIALVYIGYLIAIIVNAKVTYDWADANYMVGGITSLFWSFGKFLVQDVGIQLCLAALLGFLIPWRLTNPEKLSVKDEPE